MNLPSRAAEAPPRRSAVGAETWLTPCSGLGVHRLIVFPHAGAGAASGVGFARQFEGTGATVSIVRYPGRETRLDEAPAASMDCLVDRLAAELAPLAQGEFSLFGHSMGALVAFELAHRWRAQAMVPVRLWISGCRPPQVPAERPHLHPLPDAEFVDNLRRRYDALPAALLAHPELLALMLPALRADFGCVETYALRERPALAVPLAILRGNHDRWLDASTRAGWARHTTATVEEHVFPGGHFYLEGCVADVAQLIVRSTMGSRKGDQRG